MRQQWEAQRVWVVEHRNAHNPERLRWVQDRAYVKNTGLLAHSKDRAADQQMLAASVQIWDTKVY